MMMFAVWRSSFETALVHEGGIEVKMRHVVLSVVTALSEYRTPRDPLEGSASAREHALETGTRSAEADVAEAELPEIPCDEDAPLALTFKHEDETLQGEAVGPVYVWREDDPEQRTVAVLGWLSLSQARALAEERGYSFYED